MPVFYFHDILDISALFSKLHKKRIRELLSIAEVLDYLHYEQKAHGISMSTSAFLRSEDEIVQISAILEKQKRYAIYMLFNQFYFLSFITI